MLNYYYYPPPLGKHFSAANQAMAGSMGLCPPATKEFSKNGHAPATTSQRRIPPGWWVMMMMMLVMMVMMNTHLLDN
jgi:hypothetical protein